MNWGFLNPVAQYQRDKAVAYARQWAKNRNPNYYDYSNLGGDCTNFVSQCIFAGSGVMDYGKLGWYYIGANNHSASWTGVPFLYDFLTKNKGIGPFGQEVDMKDIQIGDISQMQSSLDRFSHSQMIISAGKIPTLENILIAAHTIDSLDRPLSTYQFKKIRFIHIESVKK